jgi:predicted RNA-binding Zn-ribbon protein involved in translation (DUF1610 family)
MSMVINTETTYVCEECGHKFDGPILVGPGTDYSFHPACPECGSHNTHPKDEMYILHETKAKI